MLPVPSGPFGRLDLGRAAAVVLVLFALFFSGCAEQKTPDLLQVTEVGPGALEADSEVKISGSGFPENRRGTLLLEGVAHTPARPPRRVAWELPLVSESRTSLVVRPGSRRLRELTEGAPHVTFRGSARVHFSPLMEGRPPLRGKKDSVVLDLFVPASGVQENSLAFYEYLGIELGADLVVRELVKDSIADQAGLRVGDRLHSLDGVRLDSLRDFLPQAQARTSAIEFTRVGFSDVGQVQIDRTDFQLLESGMAARALSILAGVALALIWAARPPRFLLWLFGDKTRARRGRAVWLSDIGQRSQILAYPLFLLTVLGFWGLMELGGDEILGLALLGSLAAGALLLCGAAFILGGKRSGNLGGFTLLGAFSATFLRALVLVPIIVATVSRASEVGSLGLVEIAHEQGVWPNEWALVRSPVTFVLAVSYLVALLPLSGRRAPLEGHRAAQDGGLILGRCAEWAGQLVLICLWVVLFFGRNESGSDQIVVGGTLLSLKVAAVAHVIAWIRARSGHLRLGESWSFFGVANLFASVAAAALSVGLVVTGVADAHAELFALFALALGASMLVLVLVSSQRSWAHMGRRIDPWI